MSEPSRSTHGRPRPQAQPHEQPADLKAFDLSAGYAAGVCGAVVGVAMTNHGVWWPLAIILGLLTGAVIGWLVAYLGIPSFVVTLAAFLLPGSAAGDHRRGRHHRVP